MKKIILMLLSATLFAGMAAISSQPAVVAIKSHNEQLINSLDQ
jgi:hypothetical protein